MSIRITRVPDNALFANYAIRFHRLCGLGIWPADGARKTLAACLKMGSIVGISATSASKWPGESGFFVVFPLCAPRNLFFHDALYRKRIVIARTDGYAEHCNSCLLIISASISRSKPPANADRTLSLSRSPHFLPPPPSPPLDPRRPPDAPRTRLHLYVVRTRPTTGRPSSTSNPLRLPLQPPLAAPPPSIAGERTSCRYDQ